MKKPSLSSRTETSSKTVSSNGLTKREKTARLIAAVLFAVVILLIPARCSIGSRDSYNEQAAMARSSAQELNARADAAWAAQNDSSFEQTLTQSRLAVPQTPEFASLIKELSTAASDAGVVLLSGTPSATTNEDEGFATWNLALGVEGTTSEFVSFLDNLSNLDRLIVVSSIDSQVTAVGDVTATVNAQFFSLEGA